MPLSRKESQAGPLLSVVIPTRNEPRIRELVADVHEALSFVRREIIVVDKSRESPNLDLALVITQRSTGLGRAILEGIGHARGDWVAVMDGDFSHRPEDLAAMVRTIRDQDFVLGSRYAPGGRNQDVAMRRIASRAFNFLAKLILGLRFTDPMSGLIVAKLAVFQRVRPSPIGFKINLELIYRATELGFKGSEVPISFQARTAGRSKAGIREGVRTLAYILALKNRPR